MGRKKSKKATVRAVGKRISQEQIYKIRFLRESGSTYPAIARKLGVSEGTVARWATRPATDLAQHRAVGQAPTFNTAANRRVVVSVFTIA